MNTIELEAFLKTQGFSGQISDSLHDWLVSLGYEGALPDMFYEFLGDLGLTGSLSDRIASWNYEVPVTEEAPQLSGGGLSRDGAAVVILFPTLIDGIPPATVTFTLTRGGVDVTGEIVGDRIPNAIGGTYVATWVASNGVEPDATVTDTEVVVTAPDPNQAPTISNITSSSAQVNWVLPFDGGSPITRNTLHWRVGTSGTPTPINNVVGPFSLMDLAADTIHQVRVRSDNASFNGTFSPYTQFRTSV